MARTAAGTNGRRAALLLCTALGGLMLLAGPALALPGAPTTVATNTGGGAPVLTNPVAGTLNIKLNAPRTVLQYSGFNVGAAETVNFRFDNRSDLAVVHATSSAIQINGTLASYVGANYGGNVWLLSAAGVFIGGTARIDVGGLLASTSIPSNLLSPTGAVLTPTALGFDFGDGAGMVTVAAGARVTGHGGTLAFLAPSVRTAAGAQIGGAGDTAVLYGAAQRYTVRFVQQAGNDLDLLDFEVPGLTAGSTAAMPLMLAGTTDAGNVYVASVSRADAVRAVLDAQGSIGATVAGLEGGSVVLTAGGGISNRAAAPLLAGGTFLHDLSTGTVTAAVDIVAQATGTLDIGLTNAGRDLSLLSTGDAIGVYDNLSAGRDLRVDALTELVAGSASAGRDATLTSHTGGLSFTSVTAGDDLRASAVTADFSSATTTGGADTEADGSNIVVTGESATLAEAHAATDLIVTTTDTIAIGFGETGASAGRDMRLTGSAIDFGTLVAGQDLALTATDGGLDADGFGDPTPLTAGRDLLLTANGEILASNLAAPRDIIIDGTSVDVLTADAGRDVRIDADGELFIGTATAGRDATFTSQGGGVTVTAVTAADDVRASGVSVDFGQATTTAGTDSEGDGSNIVITGDSVSVGEADAATDLRIVATDTIAVGFGDAGAHAGRDIVLRSAAMEFGSLNAGRDLSLTATDGGLNIDDLGNASPLTAGRDLLLTANGPIIANSLTAPRDIVLNGSIIDIGFADAGRDLTATGTVSVTMATARAGDDIRLSGPSIDIDQARATGLGTDSEGDASNIVATGGTITIEQAIAANDLLVTGTGVVTVGIGNGGLAIGTIGGGQEDYFADAGRDIVLVGASLVTGPLTAGRDVRLTATTGPIDGFGAIDAGRDVLATAAGAITVQGVTAARDLALTGASLDNGPLSSGRDLLLTATESGIAATDVGATRDLTLNAAGALTFGTATAGRDLVLAGSGIDGDAAAATGNATLVGSAIDVGTLEVGGTTLAVATAGGLTLDRFTGHAATLAATGRVDLGDATGTDVRIVGGDLDVRRSLVASTLAVETPGQMILGGTVAPGETGFHLAAADIGRLRVSGIASFFAGVTTPVVVPVFAPPVGTPTDPGNFPGDNVVTDAAIQETGGDLIVQDVTYDPANLPRIALFADRGHVVDIRGTVAPSDVGGSLQIGDANPDGRFRPASIYVSGALGTAELIVNCFGRVVPANTLSLYTVGDVIFGDASFRAAVQGTAAGDIDIFAGVPATPPRTDDHLFAVTTRLIVQANGKIVSQNSASLTGAYVGIVLIGTGATGPIIDVGTAAAADLSGSIIDSQGFLRSGPLVARAAELGPGGVNGAIFRFNGCIVGAGICTTAGSELDTPSEALRVEDYQPPRPIDITDSPLTTVLIADNIVGQGDRLTVVNDANAIVIQRSNDQGNSPVDGDTTRPRGAPSDNCTVEPGGETRCPAPADPR